MLQLQTGKNKKMMVYRKIMVVVIFAFVLSLNSCNKNGFNCIEGEGAMITKVLSLSDFEQIDLTNAAIVTISQGTSQEVKVIGHPNIISKIKATVLDKLWKIEFEDDCYRDYYLAVEILVPNIDLIKVSGSGEVIIEDFSNQSSLENTISGSGNITLNAFEGISNLKAVLSGSGSIKANKQVATLETLNLNISGSGNFHGYEINSKSSIVVVSGSGNTELTALNNLSATIIGSGNISYKGAPVITQNITGSGKLINAN